MSLSRQLRPSVRTTHRRRAGIAAEQLRYYRFDGRLRILHCLTRQPALGYPFPDELVTSRIDDVDVRSAHAVVNRIHIIGIERPRAVHPIAVAVVAVT